MKKNEKDKMLEETQNNLDNILGEESKNLLSGLFQEKKKGYKKGEILTLGELKSLPKGTIIHLWYVDECDELQNDDFEEFNGDDGSDELNTSSGFSIPIDDLDDSCLLERIDNCGWSFTVSKAILN